MNDAEPNIRNKFTIALLKSVGLHSVWAKMIK